MSFESALIRMPHDGAMLLIETIEAADPNAIRCLMRDHDRPDFPLRVQGRLHTVALVEMGAQAAAAHASIFGIGEDHVGLLLSLSRVEIAVAEIDLPPPLAAEAERLADMPGGAAYRFTVSGGGTVLLTGEATLSMQAKS
ncbi:MAG: hydroxymyristoyl-ACP dehydratase [Pseudomonadota bacterium]